MPFSPDRDAGEKPVFGGYASSRLGEVRFVSLPFYRMFRWKGCDSFEGMRFVRRDAICLIETFRWMQIVKRLLLDNRRML